jgi:hypothetical protein
MFLALSVTRRCNQGSVEKTSLGRSTIIDLFTDLSQIKKKVKCIRRGLYSEILHHEAPCTVLRRETALK